VPTRFAFEGANYYPMFQRAGLKHYCFEEEPQVEIPLTHEGRLRDCWLMAATPTSAVLE
jgi:nitroimidazol reductase NimA-like FMN-containing flavoprotein (pyridoxamine 5'-phosphate oxidase superfamily)